MARRGQKSKAVDDDEVVLSYHDCLLRKSDVNLLTGPFWLNDAIIGYYFTYLEKSANTSHESDQAESNVDEKIKFFSPELTQFIKMVRSGTEASTMLDCVINSEIEFIFFPLNDQNYDDAGGTHWSLVVYSKREYCFYHFDSMKGYNQSMAKGFANVIMKYLIAKNLTSVKAMNFRDVQCPQQGNNYDCGVFVLTYAEVILQHVKLNLKIEGCDLSNVSSLVTTQRSKLLNLINR